MQCSRRVASAHVNYPSNSKRVIPSDPSENEGSREIAVVPIGRSYVVTVTGNKHGSKLKTLILADAIRFNPFVSVQIRAHRRGASS